MIPRALRILFLFQRLSFLVITVKAHPLLLLRSSTGNTSHKATIHADVAFRRKDLLIPTPCTSTTCSLFRFLIKRCTHGLERVLESPSRVLRGLADIASLTRRQCAEQPRITTVERMPRVLCGLLRIRSELRGANFGSYSTSAKSPSTFVEYDSRAEPAINVQQICAAGNSIQRVTTTISVVPYNRPPASLYMARMTVSTLRSSL